jgi:hypothetical protein
MQKDMFESTLPAGTQELMRASAYSRFLDEVLGDGPEGRPVDTRISTLSASLRDDLMRFQRDGASFEIVEVIAACVRHTKHVTVHLQCGENMLPITVFPLEQLVHCPVPFAELVELHLPISRVMHVEPALLRPPGDEEIWLVAAARDHHPLPVLLWELAMRGTRRELLPEIAGAAVYRVAPGLDLGALPASGALLVAAHRMKQRTYNLREVAALPGMNMERAVRMLNALYLTAGLIVSRSHPNGLPERWLKRRGS